MIRRINYVLLTIIFLFFGLLFSSQISNVHAFSSNPTPTSQYDVDDYNNMLNSNLKNSVIKKDNYYKNHTKDHPQIVLMTVPNSDNESIDDYASDLLSNKRWQFGNRPLRNDVLILFANNDGEDNVRISVGIGIKYVLSSRDCSSILEDNKSLLKSNNKNEINQGLQNVYNSVTHVVDTKYANLSRSKAESYVKSEKSSSLLFYIGIIAIVLIVCGLIPFMTNNSNSDIRASNNYANKYGGYNDGSWFLDTGDSDSDSDSDFFGGGSFGGGSSGGFNGGGSSI